MFFAFICHIRRQDCFLLMPSVWRILNFQSGNTKKTKTKLHSEVPQLICITLFRWRWELDERRERTLKTLYIIYAMSIDCSPYRYGHFEGNFLQWTFNLLDRILKKFELDKYFITAWKSILYLVNLQSLVAKYCEIRKI